MHSLLVRLGSRMNCIGIFVTPISVTLFTFLLSVNQASSEKSYKNILFSSGTEHVIWNFFTILYTVLSHGAGYVIFFWGGGQLVQDKVTFHYAYVPCVHAANEHALLNRKHFPHTLTCSIQDTAHNWKSITSVSTDKMIQLATKLPCLNKLIFLCALRTN